ncbi:O-methyltransferase [Cohnella sp. AR92]|uniref:O-methyltransferase n=1 Tax=Cohnella sp. AR92 TaxID=648716 RepID=UPI001863B54E|nr:O-methyltransferase [Cohnella sp. AR92]
MSLELVPLARQVDVALRKLEDELRGLSAGTIVLQIRNDVIGKFGIRHLPLDCEDRGTAGEKQAGMTAAQVESLRRMAIEALNHKRSWTHGEISYDFVLRQGKVYLSVQFESNYNMANLMFRLHPKGRDRRDAVNE